MAIFLQAMCILWMSFCCYKKYAPFTGKNYTLSYNKALKPD